MINGRVDQALGDNRRAETIVIMMAIAIFVLGAAAFVFAYWRQNPYVAGGGLLFQALLYWPIREVLKLRRDNLILQTLPALVSSLPADSVAQEITKMLEHLRR